jgi:hypothetical protein
MANNSHVLAFDNVSFVPNGMSDTLCRLAVGGGFAARQLYSDKEECLFEAARPILVNGIEDMITRPDLADRAILLTLEAIPENVRKTEKEIADKFEREKPKIFGALLDGISEGLRTLPDVRLDESPRMADFAAWATACETSFAPAGSFRKAYSLNLENAVNVVIDADSVASAIRSLVLEEGTWTGTATSLLAELNFRSNEDRVSNKWPKNGQALSMRLRRAATFLRKVGIKVERERNSGRDRDRLIILSLVQSSVASDVSASHDSESITGVMTEAIDYELDNLAEDVTTWDDIESPADASDTADDEYDDLDPGFGVKRAA